MVKPPCGPTPTPSAGVGAIFLRKGPMRRKSLHEGRARRTLPREGRSGGGAPLRSRLPVGRLRPPRAVPILSSLGFYRLIVGSGGTHYLRLAIEPAQLGSAQLELARYGNELARLGSLSGRAESQARLGSFGSSSWLVWLTSQLKKKPSQLALAEPDASMAAGWWRNKKMSRVFLHGCGERGPAAGGAFVAPSRSSGGRGRRGAGPRPRGAPRGGAPAAGQGAGPRPRGTQARRPSEAGRRRGGPGCRGRPDGRGGGARSGEAKGEAPRP